MRTRHASPFRSAVLAAILVLGAIAELAAAPPAAQAQPPIVNAIWSGGRVLAGMVRRSQTYTAAAQTQRDFNRYYDRLRDTARTQLISGELSSLRNTQAGPQRVRVGAFVKLDAATRAEQEAVTRAIEAEKNEARRDFNRTVVREITNAVIRLPGAQQILADVRGTIANLRAAVIALQSAIAAGRPFDQLREALANQVRGSVEMQDHVRYLGTMLGQDLDRAMGGAITRVDQALQRAQEEMAAAAANLDQMDAEVAALSIDSATVAAGDQTGSGSTIRPTDGLNAALDAASNAIAFFGLIQESRGTTRDEMYQQIRSQNLQEHNVELLNAVLTVRLVTCTGVGRGEYEAAMGMLGKTPGTVPDPEDARYVVCTERQSGQPVSAYIIGGGVETTGASGEGAQSGEPTIYAGTYVGEAEFPIQVEGDLSDLAYEKAVSVNLVRLTVLEDGRIEGELSYEAQETYTGRDCGARYQFSVYGTFGGSLVGSAGTIALDAASKTNWTPFVLGQYSCGDPGSSSGSYVWTGPLQVDEDYIHGEVTATDEQGGSATFTFEAHRE